MGFAEVGLVFDKVTCVNPAQKLLLVALADRADDRGICWPSVRELSRRACLSMRSVHRHLDTLRSLGVVSTQPRWRACGEDGSRRTSSLYVLDIGGIASGKYRTDPKADNPRSEHNCQNGIVERTGETESDEKGLLPAVQNPWSEHNCQNGIVERTGETEPCDESSFSEVPHIQRSGHDCQNDTSEKPANRLTATVGSQPPDTSGRAGTIISERSTLLPPTPSMEGMARGKHGDTEGGAADAAEGNSHSLSDEDWVTLHTVLPEPMLSGLTPKGRVTVLRLIEQRCEAGWTKADMRRLLNARALPPQVKTMVGLVVARFKSDIPLDGAPPSKHELVEKEQAIREKKIAERDALLEKQARERREQNEREQRERQAQAVSRPCPLKKKPGGRRERF